MSSVITALKSHAQCCPDKLAIVGDKQSLTWAELWDEVQQLAQVIRNERGIGLYLGNGSQWIIVDLAALYADVVCVPIPMFFSSEQVKHAVNDANLSLVLGDLSFIDGDLPNFEAQAAIEIASTPVSVWRNLSKKENPLQRPGLSKITYTSGTTGNPKGVPLSLHQIEKVLDSLVEIAEGSEDDRALVLLPLSTLLENIGSVYLPLLVKATILVPDSASLGFQGSSRVDAKRLSKALNELQPTTAILVPQLLKLFITLAEHQLMPSSWRFLAVGGAPVSASQLTSAEQLGLPVYQGYGMSEASSVVAMNSLSENRVGSVGKPLRHIDIDIADDGEILVSGTGFCGYSHELGEPHSEIYATGDLGYMDKDGFLHVTGRKRDLIITSFGRNVSPEWIESEILASPVVAQVVVFGNDQIALSAVIVTTENASRADALNALKHTNNGLPDYARVQAMVIAHTPFSLNNGLLTANGRPRRQQIFAQYRDELHLVEETLHENLL